MNSYETINEILRGEKARNKEEAQKKVDTMNNEKANFNLVKIFYGDEPYESFAPAR